MDVTSTAELLVTFVCRTECADVSFAASVTAGGTVEFLAAHKYFFFQVPYTVIDQNTRDKLPPTVVRWYSSVRQFEVTSSYGLFRRYALHLFCMTFILYMTLLISHNVSCLCSRVTVHQL